MFKLIVALMAFSVFGCLATENDVLSIDRSVNNDVGLYFPNDKNIQPKFSDFKILNYVLMSNETGERWAVVTLQNLSSGNRVFVDDQLLALLADGSRISPNEYKLSVKGSETVSVTISFGESKFPILAVYTNHPNDN